MTPKSIDDVIKFIRKDTSLQDFYNYITDDGKNFTCDVNAVGSVGYTMLMVACARENIPLANALLIMGANSESVANDWK